MFDGQARTKKGAEHAAADATMRYISSLSGNTQPGLKGPGVAQYVPGSQPQTAAAPQFQVCLPAIAVLLCKECIGERMRNRCGQAD